MKPCVVFQQVFDVESIEIIFAESAVLPVVSDFAGADPVSGFQIVRSEPVRRRLFRCAQDDRSAVDVVAAEHPDRAFSETVVRHNRKKSAVHAEVGERQSDVGFASAVTCFKIGRHADLLVVRRSQTKQDLADRDKLFVAGRYQQMIDMLHRSLLNINRLTVPEIYRTANLILVDSILNYNDIIEVFLNLFESFALSTHLFQMFSSSFTFLTVRR